MAGKLVIRGAETVTMDPGLGEFRAADIVVENGAIAAVIELQVLFVVATLGAVLRSLRPVAELRLRGGLAVRHDVHGREP